MNSFFLKVLMMLFSFVLVCLFFSLFALLLWSVLLKLTSMDWWGFIEWLLSLVKMSNFLLSFGWMYLRFKETSGVSLLWVKVKMGDKFTKSFLCVLGLGLILLVYFAV